MRPIFVMAQQSQFRGDSDATRCDEGKQDFPPWLDLDDGSALTAQRRFGVGAGGLRVGRWLVAVHLSNGARGSKVMSCATQRSEGSGPNLGRPRRRWEPLGWRIPVSRPMLLLVGKSAIAGWVNPIGFWEVA